MSIDIGDGLPWGSYPVYTSERTFTPRMGTKSPLDFAAWAMSTASSSVDDLIETGSTLVLDGSSLVLWCAEQVGVALGASLSDILRQLTLVHVSDVLNARGCLLVAPDSLGVTLGFGRAVVPVRDQYVVREINESAWVAGARVPGLVY